MKKIYVIFLSFIFISGNLIGQVKYDDGPINTSSSFAVNGDWNKTNISFNFMNGTSDIAGDNEKDAIREAFKIWQDYTNLNFTEVSSGGDIQISWAVLDHGDGYPFDGSNPILAHAFYPPPLGGSLAGDIHFDDDETWTNSERLGTSSQPIDLVTVAAHEIGHAIGLAHSNDTDALMYHTYYGSHRYLGSDDISGIRSIYESKSAVISNNYTCSGGEFNIRNLPTGATIEWTSSLTGAATISCSNCQSSILTWNGSSSGQTTISAQITLPTGDIVTESKDVYIGTINGAYSIKYFSTPEPTCYDLWSIHVFRPNYISGESTSDFQWGYRLIGQTGETLAPSPSYDYTFLPASAGTYEIFMRPQNACGTSMNEAIKTITVEETCFSGWAKISTFPNPATSQILIQIDSESKESSRAKVSNIEVSLIEMNTGNISNKWNLNSGQKSYTLDLKNIKSGIYILSLKKGKLITSKTIVIRKY
ncbi:hypothetical protein COR50_09150 [Chitinophaga caeni]|uniref:Peptidase metallopeptidase domain-containing protein n=1 Tax=Chitinophaga caeni TaxID=2029983 RepID=A0A291QTR4_9BACT|nr:matrixin family metalloprotease [Chitinophaga caeni]ATL47325.1 hypothetical protein COR50_09150 [Chitinophaga caeni]